MHVQDDFDALEFDSPQAGSPEPRNRDDQAPADSPLAMDPLAMDPLTLDPEDPAGQELGPVDFEAAADPAPDAVAAAAPGAEEDSLYEATPEEDDLLAEFQEQSPAPDLSAGASPALTNTQLSPRHKLEAWMAEMVRLQASDLILRAGGQALLPHRRPHPLSCPAGCPQRGSNARRPGGHHAAPSAWPLGKRHGLGGHGPGSSTVWGASA